MASKDSAYLPCVRSCSVPLESVLQPFIFSCSHFPFPPFSQSSMGTVLRYASIPEGGQGDWGITLFSIYASISRRNFGLRSRLRSKGFDHEVSFSQETYIWKKLPATATFDDVIMQACGAPSKQTPLHEGWRVIRCMECNRFFFKICRRLRWRTRSQWRRGRFAWIYRWRWRHAVQHE